MARSKPPKPVHQLSAAQFEAMFPDEEACKVYLVARRWPNGVCCPRCGSTHVYELKTMAFKWECMDCAKGVSYRFSHLVGTIFENTNKPLRDWFRVIHLMLTSKKSMSALQIYRYMGFGSYKTAWYMCHRVRAALANEDFAKLAGIVEVDGTFVGGLAKNGHIGKRGKAGGTGGTGKTPIAGALSRKGNAVARAIETVKNKDAGGDLAGNAVPSAKIRRRAPGGGRKPKLVCDEETILKIRHFANIQCNQAEAAGALLVSESTFLQFLRRHIEAREAWELGRHLGRASLRRLQWKHTQRSPAMAIWLGKQHLGQKDITQNSPPMTALLMSAKREKDARAPCRRRSRP